ncbi:S9 family peptidase [bacterium]|nr:S9 family peptidase [bacterium]
MKKLIIASSILSLFACGEGEKKEELNTSITLKPYPEVRKDSISDDYFGTIVNDPYRWLEDDRSEETANWVKAQNEVTFDYLSQIPYRDQLKNRLTELWNYEKVSTPFNKGKYYFYYKNDGIQNQSVLYYREGLEGEEKVLLNPNEWSEDGTAAMNGLSFSKDAEYMAFGVSKAGSDWIEIQVMNMDKMEMTADTVKWVKFSGISWYKDGFYYSSYDAPKEGSEFSNKNEFHKVYYHKLGTPQSTDQLIFEDKVNPERNFYAGVNEAQTLLIISGSESTSGNTLMVKELDKNEGFITLVDDFENEQNVVGYENGEVLLFTNVNAPNNKLVKVDLKNPSKENWVDVLPEKTDYLNSVTIANNQLVASYMKDVVTALEIYEKDGTFSHAIELPGLGSAGFSGDKDTSLAFYSFSSYTKPGTIFKYDMKTKKSSIWYEAKTAFDGDKYVTNQVFYESKDGTKIPMFITHKKGLKMDGQNPTFLYAYGGFNISIKPYFDVKTTVFLEQGGIYAVANLRGGSEYGEDWHKAGMKEKKQNVFDDFIAAAEYLKKFKYTSTEKLAIHGRSNGGLLIGAVMTQRPDLAQVALPGVGVLDMLRYHQFTIGWAWAGEYGDSETKESFENLYRYSPLHNVKKGTDYPATMVTTADHDDRVVPAHSFKFISELQAKGSDKNPLLIRVDVNAGHGAGKPTSKTIEEWADIWSFVLWNQGVTYLK